MVMKQTQTKLFDFSDVGLDFCAGSKNLFPDRFKKMLALGYNERTVSSVAVVGNQVTFTYGGTHGYVADRVLKVSAPELLSINSGEFVIDSVTENTVTMTIDGTPASIAGNFTTKVAPLGWDLVYELNHIHIYKFKHIDDSNMYARLCFQNATASGNRNCIAVGIGRTVDLALGHITDPNCMVDLATCATVADTTSNLRWDFTYSTAATFNNYTYTQGYNTFGNAVVVGSKYHFLLLYSISSGNLYGQVAGLVPFYSFYDVINYPLLILHNNGATTTSASGFDGACNLLLGKEYCTTVAEGGSRSFSSYSPPSSFMPNSIDDFNTTTCENLNVYHTISRQQLGCVVGGLYRGLYNSSNAPSADYKEKPQVTTDIDFGSKVLVFSAGWSSKTWFVVPIEEIKIA